MLVSAVVVNLDRADLLEPCLASLERALAQVDGPTEVVVVDNGSRDGSAALVAARFPQARLVALPDNRGFAGGMQAGLAAARGDWVLTLNNDTTIEAPAVRRMLDAALSRPDVGAVAAQLRFAHAPEIINSAGLAIDRWGVAYDCGLGTSATAAGTDVVEVFGTSAGAALYRRVMLDAVGGFAPEFFAFLEDVDVAWRARMRGWRTLHVPRAVVLHHHSATAAHGSPFKDRLVGRNRIRLLARNATGGQLLRHGPGIVLYELTYVSYVLVRSRSAAPLQGRLAGVRGWRVDRRRGAPGRRGVALAPAAGFRAALRRRSAWGQPVE